jgi:hypothetical protein
METVSTISNVVVTSRPKRRSRFARILRVIYLRALRSPSPVVERFVEQHVTLRL